MPVLQQHSAETARRPIRPAGLSTGALAFVAAWLVAAAIARLTGAAAVVLLLVAAVVALAGASLSGWWRLRSIDVVGIVAPTRVTAGGEVTLLIDHVNRGRPTGGATEIEVFGTTVGLADRAPTAVVVTLDRAGLLDHIDLEIRSAGSPGLVWWKRRGTIPVETIHVAPASAGPILAVERSASVDPGDRSTGNGARDGDPDGTRLWRQGEGQQSIHWPSSLRSGEIIAHERGPASDSRWDLDIESDPARLRSTMEEGLRHGHRITLHTGDTEPVDAVDIKDRGDIIAWSAVAAHRQHDASEPCEHTPIWRREIPPLTVSETTDTVAPLPRLLTALTTLISLQMLLGALDGTLAARLAVTLGVVIATTVSIRACAGTRPLWVRIVVAVLAVGALVRIAVHSSGVTGLIEALRGPMPDLLIVLVILHGAEIADRRTARVHLAITAVVTAYATGLRIDGNVGWWMLAWGIAMIAACTVSNTVHGNGADGIPRTGTALSVRRIRPIIGWVVAGAVATVGLAAFVPVPDGPASLGIPALAAPNAIVDASGALLGPDGNPSTPTRPSSPDGAAPQRGALGETAGYPGFSQTLDTSVRGDLGDETVMRVRATQPAFWRGQVFTEFDGRVWRVTPETGRQIDGPRIDVPPTIGDLPAPGTPTEAFVQTYTVESDLPNVIFGAGRPSEVIFDGSVTTRTDGAIRADRTLTKGTIYSVISQRVKVTAETLRAQGDLGERFGDFAANPDVARFLTIPESTSNRTIDLASDLRVEGSTSDTIVRYENWLALNTVYDLNAPVPDGDAVDDFLFTSQRGFCEQIASSLVVMLRSQGVPARLATGYVPGERDRISGVFEVRASDAHAWVEVWFPETGWEAFDPTANVPLAGDAARSTVGADAATAIISGVVSRPLETAAAVGLLAGLLAVIRWVTELRRRRERGPWGLLHDRFMALAPDALTAPDAADDLVDLLGADSFGPWEVAETIDRVAFDPTYAPATEERKRVAADISRLERELRRR